MSNEQIKLLTKMKDLIRNGKRRFAKRKDRDIVEELDIIGITQNRAWYEILLLNKNHFFIDNKPSYKQTDALIFKKDINGYLVYIKLKLEKRNELETVCLSFHRDHQ